ncbi:MAG TPA: TAT-variant-translocated molybdopterin oxidoreductase, partial [Vicinamibacteria bacterium]|nr:TAT-variant-translocated molybdopterin oxidoreductase [Vicinamibacteria bacterium]
MSEEQRRRYWKSLEELEQSPAFLELLHREFPSQASEFGDAAGRREFMRVMGASLALAGLTGCTRQPEEKIVPYVRQPEDMVPGRPQYFATAVLDAGYAKGVLVESHAGRPTKIEGNPEHPASLGGTDVPTQAEILNLYDPDRSQVLKYLGEVRSWDAFLSAMRASMDAQRGQGGAGLRILTETVTSPSLHAQIDALLRELPRARWHQWDAAGRHSMRAGLLSVLGRAVDPVHHLDRAKVILSLDADFVTEGPGNLRYIREFARGRKLDGGKRDMSRLYAVESTPNLAGSLSDHHLRVKASEVEPFARALLAALGASGPAAAGAAPAAWSAWIAPLAKDLLAHPGATLVLAGEQQSPGLHAVVHAINERLGNVGTTVEYRPAAEPRPVDQLESLRELMKDIDAGTVSLLVIVGGNPVYTAPSDFDFAGRMDKVALRVHLGLYDDETAERCHWHVPQTHSLETWGDARAFDGTLTVLQPLIAPLYPSCRSVYEFLGALGTRPPASAHDTVREFWRGAGTLGGEFDRAWRRALHDGLMAVATAPVPVAGPATTSPVPAAPAAPVAAPRPAPPASGGMEIIFR